MIGRVCWLAGWLVRQHGSGSVFSKSGSPILMKFGTDVQHLRQMSLLTFQRSRSRFKVKTVVLKIFHLQQLSCCGSRYLHQFWQSDRSTFGTNLPFDKIQDGVLVEVSTL